MEVPKLVVVLLAVLAVGGCSRGGAVVSSTRGVGNPPAPHLVRASTKLLAKCQAAARTVGYAVPCPTLVPAGLFPTPDIGGCHLGIIGPGGIGGCARSWRRWIVGSSETADQHLVIVGSPRALSDFAKVVNGLPGIQPRAFAFCDG